MKEKLYTIELHDALTSGDECPFCWLERKLEQEALEFVLGSSYMESDTRAMPGSLRPDWHGCARGLRRRWTALPRGRRACLGV